MVPVMVDTPLMRCIDVEPRVVGCGLVCSAVPIHRSIRMCSGCMIIHDVENDSYAVLVACVDESLIVLALSICLVHSKICMCTISPAVVSVELLDRHELDGIHSEGLEVIKLTESGLDASLSICIVGKVTDKKLIDDKVVLIFDIIILDFPVVDIPVDLECRHETVVPAIVSVTILLCKVRISS